MTSDTFETVVLITQPVYQGRRSEEILETVMSLALFDRSHCVLFWDQGLSWLVPDQTPAQGKSLSKQLAALPLYGSEALYYCPEHHQADLPGQTLINAAEPLTLADAGRLLTAARYVEVF